MKALLAGGGTGGHVYPALAIAKELAHRHPDWDIQFAGRHDSIEGKVVPEDGFELNELYVSGFERYYSGLKKAKVVFRTAKSMSDSFRLLSRLKPNIVIGTGGYISGPIVLAAHLRRIPTLICEQNVIPGFTIKTLSRFADIICLPFEEARAYMKRKERCVLTGNPVRREFALYDRFLARRTFGIGERELLVVSFGGSLGAKSINDAVYGLIPFLRMKGARLVHITGRSSYSAFAERMAADPQMAGIGKNIQILAYTNEMPALLNAADLVIGRSGAMTVSEINYVGVAAIYVPLPTAVFDHQTKNAQYCVDNGAAAIIEDARLTAQSLKELVAQLLEEKGMLSKMGEASKAIGIPDSSERIAIQAESLLGLRGKES
ncbi:MAG: undecaprenyldiphospho-muramoylpentapeptide beta-N-acetylglucosaminyltransferase [Eubacteriaceae bacterium]|jgi:UDP-N-acetylglucosamine--N-acetylmuramyl-(pentapeptide) pyrophosphoryl-undecaprenol N-acetylglucosamine transferase|nr:undecaprenyldiphospho-muramoylpentapeptide beta-N-acetylglucosaminyltransferase [Eubacteriaceae bacterium]